MNAVLVDMDGCAVTKINAVAMKSLHIVQDATETSVSALQTNLL
jgi:hypothetical protein